MKSIQLREYSKFMFSKNVNRILEIINNYSKKNKISLDEISNLSINEIINNKKLKKKIDLNIKKKEIYLVLYNCLI